jgi:hypothetical protein
MTAACGAVALVAATLVPVGSAAAADLPDPVPVPGLAPIADPDAASERLHPVPSGCPAPEREQVVFVGTLTLHDAATARFTIDQLRAGSAEGFSRDGMIDIRYGDEVRFLEPGVQYIVGAAIDVEQRALVSKVREEAPLFGGSEIAGVNATDAVCPVIDDPVRTLRADGGAVETGVLSSLDGSGPMVLRALLQPLAAALAILFGLAALKLLVFAMVRSLRDLGRAG